MTNSSNRFKAQSNAAGQDTILDALRDQAGDDAPFAASSAALQAANSVLLANMRARLGKAAPTPSPIHASAAVQATVAAAESSPIVATAAVEQPDATPSLVISEPQATTTIRTEQPIPAEAAPTIPAESFDTVSYEQLLRNLPEPQAEEEDEAPASMMISPSAARRETASPTISFGRRSYDPEPAMDAAPAAIAQPFIAETEETDALDTNSYQAENDETYREWQSALRPNERQWQRVAIVGVLVAAVAVNLFFFLGNDSSTPKATVATAKSAPIDVKAMMATKAPRPVVETPAIPVTAPTERAILFPDKNPPKMNDVDENYGSAMKHEPRPLEISNQLSMPNQEGAVPDRMPTTIIPTDDAMASAAPAMAAPKQLTPPKPAGHDAPLPVPSPQKQATLNPQQLLRVLSRP